MKFRIRWMLLLMLSTFCAGQQDSSLYKFIDSHATSTYAGKGVAEFSALQTLQPGTDYWCSEEMHPDDDKAVGITFTLASQAYLTGLKVRWAYAPKEVEVAVSRDGENFEVLVPYKATPSSDISFTETIEFPHPASVLAVTLSMRKPIDKYFGIQEVRPITAGAPLTMLVSGITSPTGEMCYQVELGRENKEGASVVLDECTVAMAAARGSELWRLNALQQLVSARSNPPKCMVLQGGKTEGGGKIVISDCRRALEEADSRSNWSFEPNRQLKMMKSGSYCLTQKSIIGNAPGVGNVVANGVATATASSTADETHNPAKAIDDDVETFWASGEFPDASEHSVNFDVNLGQATTISRVRTDWEYPARHYTLSTSLDGQTFVEVAKDEANSVNTTMDTMGGVQAQYIRLTMLQPHPRYGKEGDKFLYGIRELGIFANRLQSSVQDCREAANSDNASDKVVRIPVTEFDPLVADKIGSMEDDVLARSKKVQEMADTLDELSDRMKSCYEDKKKFGERMKNAQSNLATVTMELDKILSLGTVDTSKATSRPGDSASNPAEDCYIIKGRGINAISGFYWIQPRCTSEPLRAYCDMKTGTAIYIWNGNPPRNFEEMITSKVNSVEDVRLHCAEVGLEPLVLKRVDQLKAVQNALHVMGFNMNGKGAIPLAFDYSCSKQCTGTFRDLQSGAVDQTSLLSSTSGGQTSKQATANTAGIGLSGEASSYFDFSSTEIAAIVCSTNTMEGESEMPHDDVSCETTGNSDVISGIVNTNIVVECPAGCDEDCTLDTFGSDGVYAVSSSICRSAVHAGVIKKGGGLVNVALESVKTSFEGSSSNGVDSKTLNKPERSMRIGSVAKECPIEEFENQPSSFMEMSSSSMARVATIEQSIPQITDYATARDVENGFNWIDATFNIDAEVIAETLGESARAVGDARKLLKPAEALQESQEAMALQLYDSTKDVGDGLNNVSEDRYNVLEDLRDHLKELNEQRQAQHGFGSFSLDYKSTRFLDLFDVVDSVRTKNGPSSWGFVDSPIAGRENAVGQSSGIVGMRSGHGTFAFLKGHRFYDTITSLDFYARGSGVVGVAFRARDINNMFMLELSQIEGIKRLLRISGGEATVIASKEDGGYLQGKWTHVRIETTHGNIKVCVGEAGTEPVEIFNLLDESFLVGTIGLHSSSMQNGAFFDNIVVRAKSCTKVSKNAPPLPPRCSHFKESYFTGFRSLYEVVEPAKSKGAPGIWEYKSQIGGRPKVLAQLNAVRGANEIGTSAILRGHRLCKDGYMSFDFFPECESGVIGAVFRYMSPGNYNLVEVSSDSLRLRSVVDGVPTTLARDKVTMEPNAWHTLHINFEGPTVWATLMSGGQSIGSLGSVDLFAVSPLDGRVGLAAYDCGGIAFDNIQISPFETEQIGQPTPLIPNRKEPWNECAQSVHLLERRDACQSMLRTQPLFRRLSCSQNYCSECCHYHTSLLKAEERTKCETACHRNDHLAKRVEENFMSMLSGCLEGEGPAFDHCDSGDTDCALEACHLCCMSSEGVEDILGEAVDLLQNAPQREVAECKYQCSNKVSSA